MGKADQIEPAFLRSILQSYLCRATGTTLLGCYNYKRFGGHAEKWKENGDLKNVKNFLKKHHVKRWKMRFCKIEPRFHYRP